VVLGIMREENMITQEEYEEAKAAQPKVRGLAQQRFSRYYGARYHVAAVRRELDRRGINIGEGGYTITTTLDTEVQREAEKAVESTVRGYRGYDVNAGAFICIDSEGRVLADVGGMNFAKNQYSRTTQSRMQPGSAFKTFVYAEALKEGIISEYSDISNEMVKVPKGGGEYWVPRNHGRYGGTVSVFSGFTQSVNVPAVRLFMQIGSSRAAQLITKDFGFASKIDPFPAVALGASDVKPIEMAEAYSVIMLDGKRVKPTIIKEIMDPSGEVVFQAKSEYSATRIGPDVCNVMDRLMRGVVTSGTGKKAASCPDAHGKTGTTNGGKSVWFCGYAKGIVGIAWAGNEYYDKKRDRWLLREMPESYGGDIAAPMWARAMRAATAKYGSDVRPDFKLRPEVSDERTVEEEEEAERKREEKRLAEEAKNAPPADLRDDETEGPTAPASNPVVPDGTPTTGGGTPPTTPVEPPKTEDPPKREPAKRPEPARNDEETGSIEVEVCADSGLLATRYCPETINRKYAKSRRPRRACGVHKSPQEGGGD
ncbi:MAG TPA: penicillin-binding transpeptidase domain-containing protein, partial [Fimbriimonas sp.]|nr:penicillin-binding transpeptidase domain-containing protein [Fimbriimonas sp.]